MKTNKILITICTIFAALTLFVSCGESDSVYSESWFDKTGYVTFINDPYEGQIIENFYAGSIPDDVTNAQYAKRYSHRYIKSPTCRLNIQNWVVKISNDEDGNDKIGYETVKTYKFQISSTPVYVGGLWFSCDENNVYVYNTLYNYGYTNKKAGSPTEKDYRFIVDINGICDLQIEMTESVQKKPWE